MELPKSYPVYFERRKYLMIILFIVVFISGIITYYSFRLYTVYHIYSAFVFTVSLVYLSWLYFNPFIAITPSYFEVNSGLFSHKKYMYRDIRKIEVNDEKNRIILIFNDHEVVEISIRPIRKKEKERCIELIKIHIYKDLLERD